jgi:hypothetical protein
MPNVEIPARGRELAKMLERPERHPKAIKPNTFVFTVLLSVGGSIIGLQVLTTLGITPNTALIGVLLAIAVSRISHSSTTRVSLDPRPESGAIEHLSGNFLRG